MSDTRDPLACSFEDVARMHLRDGIRMSTRDKIQFFEDMIELAWKAGAIKAPRPEKHKQSTKDERRRD